MNTQLSFSAPVTYVGNPTFRMRVLHPPYSSFGRPLDLKGDTTLEPGAIIVLDLSPADSEAVLLHWVPRLRFAYPTGPVVLRLCRAQERVIARVAYAAAQVHARAVVLEHEPLLETLRTLLSRPLDLSEDVSEWLDLRGVSMPPRLTRVIREAIRQPDSALHVMLRDLGEGERGTRNRFRELGLPAPSRWMTMARALRVALHLQANPGDPLMSISFELGYADHSALSRHLRKVFGLTPGAIRATLGWEWLLDRWLQREQVPLGRLVAV